MELNDFKDDTTWETEYFGEMTHDLGDKLKTMLWRRLVFFGGR